MADSVLGAPPTDAAPIPAATASAPPAAPVADTPPAAPAGKWYDTIKTPDLKAWVEKLNIPDPEAMVKKAFHQEKLIGAEKAGRTVVLPKEGDPDDVKAEFYAKLGRPETPDGYKFTVPEGDSGEFAKAAAEAMFKAGVTADQAKVLDEFYNSHVQTLAEAQEKVEQEKRSAEFAGLKREWGQKFNEQAAIARRAMSFVGLNAEQGSALERAIGVDAAAKLFARFGSLLSEGRLITGESAGVMSPDTARSRLTELKADKAWANKLLDGDPAARAESERLHSIIRNAV